MPAACLLLVLLVLLGQAPASFPATAAQARTHPHAPVRAVSATRPQALAHQARFTELPPEHKRAVLLALWYALNWHRELLSAFGVQLSVSK